MLFCCYFPPSSMSAGPSPMHSVAGVLKNISLSRRSGSLCLYFWKDEGGFIAHTHVWTLIPKQQMRNGEGAG